LGATAPLPLGHRQIHPCCHARISVHQVHFDWSDGHVRIETTIIILFYLYKFSYFYGTIFLCVKSNLLEYINQREIRLHKRFHMFDFIYYNITIFIVPNFQSYPYTTHTTYGYYTYYRKKISSIELISTVGSFNIGLFLLHTSHFETVV
jgi:hypothetical protein